MSLRFNGRASRFAGAPLCGNFGENPSVCPRAIVLDGFKRLETMFCHPCRAPSARGNSCVDVNMLGKFRRLAASPLALGLRRLPSPGFSSGSRCRWSAASARPPGFRLREAWDTDAYFYVGVPSWRSPSRAAGFLHPERAGAGRSGSSPATRRACSCRPRHAVGPEPHHPDAGARMLLAVVFAIPALAGAEAARRLAERAY